MGLMSGDGRSFTFSLSVLDVRHAPVSDVSFTTGFPRATPQANPSDILEGDRQAAACVRSLGPLSVGTVAFDNEDIHP